MFFKKVKEKEKSKLIYKNIKSRRTAMNSV